MTLETQITSDEDMLPTPRQSLALLRKGNTAEISGQGDQGDEAGAQQLQKRLHLVSDSTSVRQPLNQRPAFELSVQRLCLEGRRERQVMPYPFWLYRHFG